MPPAKRKKGSKASGSRAKGHKAKGSKRMGPKARKSAAKKSAARKKKPAAKRAGKKASNAKKPANKGAKGAKGEKKHEQKQKAAEAVPPKKPYPLWHSSRGYRPSSAVPGMSELHVQKDAAGRTGITYQGTTVTAVMDPAAEAGLMVGDDIISIDGKPVKTKSAVNAALAAAPADSKFTVVVPERRIDEDDEDGRALTKQEFIDIYGTDDWVERGCDSEDGSVPHSEDGRKCWRWDSSPYHPVSEKSKLRWNVQGHVEQVTGSGIGFHTIKVTDDGDEASAVVLKPEEIWDEIVERLDTDDDVKITPDELKGKFTKEEWEDIMKEGADKWIELGDYNGGLTTIEW